MQLQLLFPILVFPLQSLAVSLPSLITHLLPRQYGSDESGTWLPANYASGSSSGCSHYGANGECGGASIDTDEHDFSDPATLLGKPGDHTATALPPSAESTSVDGFLSEATAMDSSDAGEATSSADETSSSGAAMASMTIMTTGGGAAVSTGAMPSQTGSGGSGQDNGASSRGRWGGLCALIIAGTGFISLL